MDQGVVLHSRNVTKSFVRWHGEQSSLALNRACRSNFYYSANCCKDRLSIYCLHYL